ncbi:MAG: hypothetical protein V4638_06150 [Bacteroidota bacterium]
MSETLDNAGNGAGKRPAFLSVLCILTFIGSGLGIIGGLLGLIGSSALGMFAPQGTMIVQIVSLLACALCLFGAIKMWGLAKQGYMMYVAGAVLSIVGSVISAVTIKSYLESTMTELNAIEGFEGQLGASFGDAMNAAAQSAAWMAVVMSVIINGLFIILYTVNKKHLTK